MPVTHTTTTATATATATATTTTTMSSSFQRELQRSFTVLCLACRHAFPPAVVLCPSLECPWRCQSGVPFLCYPYLVPIAQGWKQLLLGVWHSDAYHRQLSAVSVRTPLSPTWYIMPAVLSTMSRWLVCKRGQLLKQLTTDLLLDILRHLCCLCGHCIVQCCIFEVCRCLRSQGNE